MNDGMAVIKSYFEGWVDDMKVKVDGLGWIMDDMKVDNFVDRMGDVNVGILKKL